MSAIAKILLRIFSSNTMFHTLNGNLRCFLVNHPSNEFHLFQFHPHLVSAEFLDRIERFCNSDIPKHYRRKKGFNQIINLTYWRITYPSWLFPRDCKHTKGVSLKTISFAAIERVAMRCRPRISLWAFLKLDWHSEHSFIIYFDCLLTFQIKW